jgi:hypothetical protein
MLDGRGHLQDSGLWSESTYSWNRFYGVIYEDDMFVLVSKISSYSSVASYDRDTAQDKSLNG